MMMFSCERYESNVTLIFIYLFSVILFIIVTSSMCTTVNCDNLNGVPKISTNEVEGIIRHVDSLMNPQTTMKNDTVNTITTPTTDTTVNDKDGIVIDDHLLECKNQCSNLVLFEAGLIDSITSSEIMETSSEYNPSDRLHSSSIREYYHLTSEEDLGNSDEEDVDDDSEKNNDSDNKTSAIRQQQEEHEETI
uniref:RUN domain-containing protein n=1 Tax=Schistosoma mansoni TaxID=6183 RepID=A0A5K4EQJ2_SCHMA